MAEWQGFYSIAQVSRLAGVPRRTLYDWKAKSIISPSVRVVDAGLVVDEGYTYADLAIIKLMRALRNRQLNLRSVVTSLRHLYERFGPPDSEQWENAHVYILGREVYAQKPDAWDTTVPTRRGQKAMPRVLGELFEEDAAIVIPREYDAYVEMNPKVMGGQPVVRNTRVPTTTLAMMYEQGVKIGELADLYSPIPRATISKAIHFEQALDQALAKVSA